MDAKTARELSGLRLCDMESRKNAEKAKAEECLIQKINNRVRTAVLNGKYKTNIIMTDESKNPSEAIITHYKNLGFKIQYTELYCGYCNMLDCNKHFGYELIWE